MTEERVDRRRRKAKSSLAPDMSPSGVEQWKGNAPGVLQKGERPDIPPIGGSKSDEWNISIVLSVADALWIGAADPKTQQMRVSAAIAGLTGIDAKDEIEGQIAAQMLACHRAAMECYRRAMLAKQTFEGRRENLAQANKLSRTHATLIEALNRYRGKGQQIVRVERVTVHQGGQAIVGPVSHQRVDVRES
jgi:hypothetical protein